MKDDYIAAFMMSSILLNPQLLIYSSALGSTALSIRFISCFLCGITAGLLVNIFYRNKGFFNFKNFSERNSKDIDPNMLIRLIKNIGRNIKATGLWFLIGIILTALYQRYIPSEFFAGLFVNNRGFGVLMAATISVPLYVWRRRNNSSFTAMACKWYEYGGSFFIYDNRSINENNEFKCFENSSWNKKFCFIFYFYCFIFFVYRIYYKYSYIDFLKIYVNKI